MRFTSLAAALLVAAPVAFSAGAASAGTFNSFLGERHRYEGRWCAQMNYGAGYMREDCSFDSFERCTDMVIAGNRGFCTQNPAFARIDAPPPRKRARHRGN